MSDCGGVRYERSRLYCMCEGVRVMLVSRGSGWIRSAV